MVNDNSGDDNMLNVEWDNSKVKLLMNVAGTQDFNKFNRILNSLTQNMFSQANISNNLPLWQGKEHLAEQIVRGNIVDNGFGKAVGLKVGAAGDIASYKEDGVSTAFIAERENDYTQVTARVENLDETPTVVIDGVKCNTIEGLNGGIVVLAKDIAETLNKVGGREVNVEINTPMNFTDQQVEHVITHITNEVQKFSHHMTNVRGLQFNLAENTESLASAIDGNIDETQEYVLDSLSSSGGSTGEDPTAENIDGVNSDVVDKGSPTLGHPDFHNIKYSMGQVIGGLDKEIQKMPNTSEGDSLTDFPKEYYGAVHDMVRDDIIVNNLSGIFEIHDASKKVTSMKGQFEQDTNNLEEEYKGVTSGSKGSFYKLEVNDDNTIPINEENVANANQVSNDEKFLEGINKAYNLLDKFKEGIANLFSNMSDSAKNILNMKPEDLIPFAGNVVNGVTNAINNIFPHLNEASQKTATEITNEVLPKVDGYAQGGLLGNDFQILQNFGKFAGANLYPTEQTYGISDINPNSRITGNNSNSLLETSLLPGQEHTNQQTGLLGG